MQNKFNDMVVLTYALMHQVVVYHSIPILTYYRRSVIAWKSKLKHFWTIYLLFIIVITPFNLLITEKEEEFHYCNVT
jgi:hypothetical protein